MTTPRCAATVTGNGRMHDNRPHRPKANWVLTLAASRPRRTQRLASNDGSRMPAISLALLLRRGFLPLRLVRLRLRRQVLALEDRLEPGELRRLLRMPPRLQHLDSELGMHPAEFGYGGLEGGFPGFGLPPGLLALLREADQVLLMPFLLLLAGLEGRFLLREAPGLGRLRGGLLLGCGSGSLRVVVLDLGEFLQLIEFLLALDDPLLALRQTLRDLVGLGQLGLQGLPLAAHRVLALLQGVLALPERLRDAFEAHALGGNEARLLLRPLQDGLGLLRLPRQRHLGCREIRLVLLDLLLQHRGLSPERSGMALGFLDLDGQPSDFLHQLRVFVFDLIPCSLAARDLPGQACQGGARLTGLPRQLFRFTRFDRRRVSLTPQSLQVRLQLRAFLPRPRQEPIQVPTQPGQFGLMVPDQDRQRGRLHLPLKRWLLLLHHDGLLWRTSAHGSGVADGRVRDG